MLRSLVGSEMCIRDSYEGGKKLHLDFEKQKIQLQKWGLMSILPAFQMQAWLRVSRAQLVVEMSSRSLLILKSKIKHTDMVLKQLVNDKDKDKGGSSGASKKLLSPSPTTTMSSSKSTGDLSSSGNGSHRSYTESLTACIAFCQPVEGIEILLLFHHSPYLYFSHFEHASSDIPFPSTHITRSGRTRSHLFRLQRKSVSIGLCLWVSIANLSGM